MAPDELTAPLPAPLGRWMLRRMVAGAVRYGHEFSVLLVRGAAPDAVAAVLRGADLLAHWDGGDLLERAVRALEADLTRC
jgi:hypothetical protein